MLRTLNVSYGYENGKNFDFPDIRLDRNERLLISGNSGVGKSTLLNLLGLILAPKSGQIEINGQLTSSIKANELPRFRAEHVGFVFQKPYFVQSLNVLDNLVLAGFLAKKGKNTELARKLAGELGITDLLGKKTMSLSGGEQQRVSIARALMNAPGLVLADEPTSALDDTNTDSVYELLSTQCIAYGAALIVVSHDQRLKTKIEKQLTL
jgi:ABC-type lipoprotein export system ATPase subunit